MKTYQEMSENVINALRTVVPLPRRIVSLSLQIDLHDAPQLTVTSIIGDNEEIEESE